MRYVIASLAGLAGGWGLILVLINAVAFGHKLAIGDLPASTENIIASLILGAALSVSVSALYLGYVMVRFPIALDIQLYLTKMPPPDESEASGSFYSGPMEDDDGPPLFAG